MAVNCAISLVANSSRLLQKWVSSFFVAAQSMLREKSNVCVYVLRVFLFVSRRDRLQSCREMSDALSRTLVTLEGEKLVLREANVLIVAVVSKHRRYL